MKTLRYGKWSHQMATAEEVAIFRSEARQMVEKYGWQNRKVSPYSIWEPVLDIVNFGVNDGVDDYDRCSHGSKVHICQMLNGLVPIFEAWEKNHIELELNGVEMRKKNGKIVKVLPDDVEFYLECGIAVMA